MEVRRVWCGVGMVLREGVGGNSEMGCARSVVRV